MEYLKAPLWLLYSSRIVWLVPLVFVNVLSGAGIAHFQNLIGSFVALVIYLPLLIASGGNAGAQAATLVTRSMALGEMHIADFITAIGRELVVSTLLGISMGIAVFLLGLSRSGIKIGVVTSLAMITNVVLGSIIGLSLPFILRKLKLDPAVASGPLVSSVADIMGVVVYLSIASAILL
jgi:magnesium transporter